MSLSSPGALRRLGAVLAGIVLLSAPALAHEGHDPVPSRAGPAMPARLRIALASETYEIVGLLGGERLTLYLDRFGTNEPVADARIGVTLGQDDEVPAEPQPDGTFLLASPKLAGHGTLEVVVSVSGSAGDDLLIGTLDRPDATAPAALAVPAGPGLRVAGHDVPLSGLVAAGALALGFLFGVMVRSRGRPVAAAGLALAVVVVSTGFALAHEGHDHGEPATSRAGSAGAERPERLADGAVFLPKPSQRILEVRTVVTKAAAVTRATTLLGRIVADPNHSGLVQSIGGGRVTAPEGALLPRLGQALRRGDILATVEVPIIPADRAILAEKIGDIEQQSALAEARLARARRLVATGAATTVAVSDAELEVEGLKRRREAVREIRSAPEVLRAPVDGVLASSRVVAGQVVQAQDILFQIVDPKRLFVEAIVFHDSDLPSLGADEASATATDGARLRLSFQGSSRALQQQSATVQFAVLDPPPSLSLGQPVTVMVPSGPPESGIVLPREAVVRGASGETLVWRHVEPERFEPRLVRTEPLDSGRVIVRAGLAEGERVLVRGADLVNQIR